MVKNPIVDLPRGNKTVLVAPNIILLQHGVQLTGPAAWAANPYSKHACMATNRPFFNHRLEPGRCRSDPEIDRKIIRAKIPDPVAEADLAVDSIEVKRLPHHAVGEKQSTGHRARVCAHLVSGSAFASPPTDQSGWNPKADRVDSCLARMLVQKTHFVLIQRVIVNLHIINQ